MNQDQRDELDAVVFSLLRKPNIAQCEEKSLLLACFDIYKIGLDPDENKRLVYVIPYGNKATVQIGVYGWVELMYRSGVKDFKVLAIYENDEFDASEQDGKFTYTHKHYSLCGHNEGGNVKAVLCRAILKDGIIRAGMYGRDKLLKAKKAAQTKNVWDAYEDEMLMKTAAKNFAKYMRLTPAMNHAITVDTHGELDENYDKRDREIEVADFFEVDSGEIKKESGNVKVDGTKTSTRRRRSKPETKKKEEAKEEVKTEVKEEAAQEQETEEETQQADDPADDSDDELNLDLSDKPEDL